MLDLEIALSVVWSAMATSAEVMTRALLSPFVGILNSE
jgi:hypothetical protein